MKTKPSHALEKILARAAGLSQVETGETIFCEVDLGSINDLYLQVLRSFEEMGAKKVKYPDKVAFVMDHYAPSPTILAARNQKEMRDFAFSHGIENFFDINKGVCHQVLVESGLVVPSSLIVETDSHTVTMGALGAFGTGCGATDMAAILATGKIWLRTPEIIEMHLEGFPGKGAFAKDVALKILKEYGTEVANYKGIDYTGEFVDKMGLSERMTLCNMSTEMGAKTSYMQPSESILSYVKSRSKKTFEPVHTDPGYKYNQVYNVNLDGLVPQVACPSRVDNVKDVQEVEGQKVDQAMIGTCTGGRLEDLRIAAKILSGRKIKRTCRLLITPASSEVLASAMKEGIISALMDAGATLVTPGCGACLGAHDGVLTAGEICITASSRNFPGRMGSADSKVFVASPATVAASAIEGKIQDPRRYL